MQAEYQFFVIEIQYRCRHMNLCIFIYQTTTLPSQKYMYPCLHPILNFNITNRSAFKMRLSQNHDSDIKTELCNSRFINRKQKSHRQKGMQNLYVEWLIINMDDLSVEGRFFVTNNKSRLQKRNV